MEFLKKDKNEKWEIDNKTTNEQNKTNININDDSTNDSILTLPNSLNNNSQEQNNTSTIEYTENLIEAEKLNKEENSQITEIKKVKQPIIVDNLNENIEKEIVSNSEDFINNIIKEENNISRVEQKTNTNKKLSLSQKIQKNFESRKSNKKQEINIESIFSTNNSNNGDKQEDYKKNIEDLFNSKIKEKTKEKDYNNIIENIFENKQPNNNSSTKPTEVVQSIFISNKTAEKQIEKVDLNKMQNMLHIDKKVKKQALPTKDELFKTLTKKDE